MNWLHAVNCGCVAAHSKDNLILVVDWMSWLNDSDDEVDPISALKVGSQVDAKKIVASGVIFMLMVGFGLFVVLSAGVSAAPKTKLAGTNGIEDGSDSDGGAAIKSVCVGVPKKSPCNPAVVHKMGSQVSDNGAVTKTKTKTQSRLQEMPPDKIERFAEMYGVKYDGK